MFFLKIQTVKKFSPLRRSVAPIYTKIVYDLTIAIENKCFEFQNNCLKRSVFDINASNFVLDNCVKEIKNKEQHQIFLGDMHQNVIITKLYHGATNINFS